MRNAAAAIVPLFLAIMLLFWFIMFMGGSSDTLRGVSNVENLRHLQTKLLLPALKEKYKQERELGKSGPAASAAANAYVKKMMYKNNIDTRETN